jgi:tRNA pseudouridine38-40 synthase
VVARLIVSYRGGAYAGWQRQANALSVQEVLERALGGLAGRPIRVFGASRTDAGVHARGQVAHLDPDLDSNEDLELPLGALVHGTNRKLPEDVRVLAADRMPAGFHARKHAASKVYSYRLSRAAVLSPLDAPFAVRVDPRIDPARLAAATAFLVGRHDFSAFAAAGGSHRQPFRRVLAAGWTEEDPELRFTIEGEGFLRGMVRALVGTLVDVGLGRRTPEELAALLAGAPRGAAGVTVPARGLVLERVIYPPEWQPAEPAEAGTSAWCEDDRASAQPRENP